MWTRPLLKENAKHILQMRYWKCFLACLIASALSGITDLLPDINVNLHTVPHHLHSFDEFYFYTLDPFFTRAAALTGIFAVLLALLALVSGLLLHVFLSAPIEVGFSRFLMENRQGDAPIETLFSVFRTPYMNVVRGMLFYHLRVFAWSLLLIVPGIIKGLEYSLVPYLLAENPYMEPARARELSSQMTMGEKWNIFVLSLSFLGWHILAGIAGAAVTLGFYPALGGFFIRPYVSTTFAELYAALRAKAFARGFTDETELAGFVRR